MKHLSPIILLIILSGNFVHGQDLHSIIQKTYGGFIPQQVSSETYNAKMKEFESFWQFIKADTSKYLNELRTELQREDNPSYFYWDGIGLLTTTSKSQSNQNIILKALKNVDIQDVDTDLYFHLLQKYALKNIDISEFAIKILDRKNFNAVIYAHAFRIDKSYCLYYLLIPLNTTMYIDQLINRYNKEDNIENKKLIINILWHSCSCIADNFLEKLKDNNETENEIKIILEKLNVGSKEKKEQDKAYEETVQRRQEVYRYITDYTIKEIDPLTKKLKKYNCL